MIWYDYSLNRYGHWDAEYDTITLHYGKKYNIIVVGQPYMLLDGVERNFRRGDDKGRGNKSLVSRPTPYSPPL